MKEKGLKDEMTNVNKRIYFICSYGKTLMRLMSLSNNPFEQAYN